MILEGALLDVLPGRTQEFEKAFAEASELISSAPGYSSQELQRCIETPERLGVDVVVPGDQQGDHSPVRDHRDHLLFPLVEHPSYRALEPASGLLRRLVAPREPARVLEKASGRLPELLVTQKQDARPIVFV